MKPFLLDTTPKDWHFPDTPEYRKRQLIDWIFKKRAHAFSVMSNLPVSFREKLENTWELQSLRLAQIQGSKDTTRKLLWELRKGDYIESVLIPANPSLYGTRADRHTLCVSTQVGCAYGCKFCASGLEGWKRNLTPAEIVGQIIETERATGVRVDNLVFMGMGEPLANYEALLKALEILNAPWGVGIGARHITISTSGLVPKIISLAEQPQQYSLAISLHGATDSVRDQIMPINRKYPIAKLLDACETYQKAKGRLITFEYILIADVNDSKEQALQLVQHARRIYAKINIIPYNKVEGLPWSRPTESKINAFVKILHSHGVKATVRLEKGHDIDAACGQLRLRQLRNSN